MTFYIVDRHGDLTRSLAMLLAARGLRIEVRSSGEELLASIDPCRAACVLVAADVPGMDATEIAEQLGRRGVEIPVLMVDASRSPGIQARSVASAIRARHPLLDNAARSGSGASINTDSDGTRRPLNATPSSSAIAPLGVLKERYQLLTAREREVARLAAEGLTSKELARRLHLSKNTIDNHRAHILAKLDLDNFVQVSRLLAALPVEP